VIDLIQEAIAANQADAALYSRGVRIWMRIMAVTLFCSIVFVPWKFGARWILVAALLNVAALILVRAAFPELPRHAIGTAVHLLFWTGALGMIWRPQFRERREAEFAGALGSAYRVWLIAASLVMSVSLVFDARAALVWLL
jgi:hypothetical protein